MNEKASFFERLIAYVIDMTILFAIMIIVTSIISTPAIDQLQKEVNDIYTTQLGENLDINQYVSEVSSLVYRLERESMLIGIISILLSTMYFMYYQFINKGQTIGKKIMKIKIIKQNLPLELNDLVVRGLLINGILISMVTSFAIFIANETTFYTIKLSLETFQLTFIVISTLMILYRKDKRGLHDLISKTAVIKEAKEE